jgi:hypothetical protein
LHFEDFSPPSTPSLDQQRDALQKGLGRVVHWAKAGTLASEPLLNACLIDQRFDVQCEDNRSDWVWNLIRITGSENKFRGQIENALRRVTVERDSDQLCELAFHFARHGEAEFVKLLYDVVERKPFVDSPNIGMEELLELDGETAFRFLARMKGKRLISEPWEWYDATVVNQAIEVFGEQRVREILDESSDQDVLRFGMKWKENLEQPRVSESLHQDYTDRMRSIPAGEVIQAVQSEDQAYWLRGWGKHASDEDLEQVLECLWSEQNPNGIVKILRIFAARPLPSFDQRIIEFNKHPDHNVRRWAVNALAQNTDPMIRQFALQELVCPTLDQPVESLFINNFVKGDEQQLLDHTELSDHLDQRHWMLMNLFKVLEKNEDCDCEKLGQIIYFHTPCENCRSDAARLLHARHKAPDWLIDECRSDANEDCHSVADLVDNHLESGVPPK